MRIGLGTLVGAWAGATVASLVVLAIDSGFDAQTLAGGYRLRDKAILAIIAGSALLGAFLGASLGAARR